MTTDQNLRWEGCGPAEYRWRSWFAASGCESRRCGDAEGGAAAEACSSVGLEITVSDTGWAFERRRRR